MKSASVASHAHSRTQHSRVPVYVEQDEAVTLRSGHHAVDDDLVALRHRPRTAAVTARGELEERVGTRRVVGDDLRPFRSQDFRAACGA